jgi:eukaryotic-like serine/threonine-protein kinase
MVERSSFSKMVGATLGNYRLEQLIERDSIGPVFIARATTTNKLFLLRLLVLAGERTPEARIVYVGRFQQEARQVASLQHPCILPLVDYGNNEGLPYLVWPQNEQMKQLYSHIVQNGPLDTLTASRYLDQIAAALEYAHQRAVLHRNLATRCIYIEPATPPKQSRLVVTEFGVLRMLEAGMQDSQKDILPLIIESEGCPPEQLQGRPVDTSTDVYALGAVLYRLLTGRRTFTGKTRDDVIKQILRTPVPPLSASRSDLPPRLDEIMARAMAKDPAKRFQHPVELANAYHDLVAPRDTARPPLAVTILPATGDRIITPAQPPRVPDRLVRSPQVSRRRVIYYIAAGGVSAVAVVAVATHFLTSGTTSSSQVAASTTVTTSGSSSSTATTPAQTHGGKVIARAADVPANSAKAFPIANQSNPGILVHLANSNTFVAFDSTCTHLGCAVNYSQQDKLLECPCHEAAFDPAKNAAVVQGPATTPLKAIAITVNADGTITTG